MKKLSVFCFMFFAIACSHDKNAHNEEYYIDNFNKYFKESAQEHVIVSAYKESDDALIITKSDTNETGYISFDAQYNEDSLNTAFKYIDEAIARFPDRLDMRLGKAAACREIKNSNRLLTTLTDTLRRSGINKNRWLWTGNTLKENGQAVMLDSIQEYCADLFKDEKDAELEALSMEVLKYYPDNVPALTNMGILSGIRKDHETALKYLKKAETLAPKDKIVLSNILRIYQDQKDSDNISKYENTINSL
ncbi:MAG: hypothetical protein LBQ47_06675 [Endomicrobium sp.]|jgi:tetratricopeptide (TPR) repeat protein|nr:hypothetical protein [Endomicrobium sp.]